MRESACLLLLALVFATSVRAFAGEHREQRLPDGLLREFAHGNPVDLAWWESPQARETFRDERRVLVLDASAGTVSSYTPDGELVLRFGALGSGHGELVNPQGIATDRQGLVYVADTGNDRIQIFEPTGALVRVIGRTGSAEGDLNDPRGIAIADMAVGNDLLVVSDTANDRLSLFSREGKFKGQAALARPLGLNAVSGWGVVVASGTSKALQNVYDLRRVTEYEPLANSWPAAEMQAPVDLVSWDSLYVADSRSRQVVIFDDGYRLLRRILGFDAAPRAVLNGSRHEQQSVYVADGRRVVEIALVVESPLPVFEAFRQRLAAGDVDGALAFIHPAQRQQYREIYEAIGPDLPADAEQMKNARVEKLRDDEATVVITSTRQGADGRTIESGHPVRFVRSPDGPWLIVEY